MEARLTILVARTSTSRRWSCTRQTRHCIVGKMVSRKLQVDRGRTRKWRLVMRRWKASEGRRRSSLPSERSETCAVTLTNVSDRSLPLSSSIDGCISRQRRFCCETTPPQRVPPLKVKWQISMKLSLEGYSWKKMWQSCGKVSNSGGLGTLSMKD